MNKIFWGFLGFLAFSPNVLCSPLFVISKSTNHNQVFYDLNGGDVTVYWKMFEQDGRREELTGFERSRVYGIDVLKDSFAGADDGTAVRFSVRALPTYPIVVKRINGSAEARPTMRLMGEEKVVQSIYLKLSGGLISGLFGGVEEVRITCQGRESAPEVIVLHEKSGSWHEFALL